MHTTHRSVLIGVLVIISALLAPITASSAAEIIGRVKVSTGDVRIVSQTGTRAAHAGTQIRHKDTLITGEDSSVGVTFRDDSRTSLGPNSEMQMSEFKFEPAENQFAFVSTMVKGTMFFVSGLITKLSPKAARVETPTATIGIRGTRFLLKVDNE